MYLDYEKVDRKTAERLAKLIEKSYYSYWKKKRTFDLISATLILIVLIIPILIMSLIIFIDDPHGSPFYKQIRIGRHGKKFYMYKFRSMYVGKFIRKCSIDELPQLFNVFKGNMSLVGPRPPLPDEVEQYTDYDKLRLIVTPGITCTWQISPNRNDIPFDKWLEMDLDYIEHRTTWTDIKIIFKTPIAMLSATGR